MLQDFDRVRRAREAVRKMKNVEWLFTKEGSQFFYAMHQELASIEKLVELAREGDKNAWEILRDRGRDAARSGINVPTCFHEFVWEWFLDGPPKAKPGPSLKDTALNSTALMEVVRIISCDFGFPEYTPYEHRDDPDAPMSACRLVAEEFGLNERTLEDINTRKQWRIRPPG